MKNNKGITMISLVITIIVLLILSSIIIYNVMGQLGIKRVNYLYVDIESLSTKVAEYYLKNEKLPVYDNKYVENKNQLETLFRNNGATTNITNVNDGDEYYVLDLSKLDNLTLNYGDDYKEWTSTSSSDKIQNIYIINSVTHQIYFPHGVRSGDEYYFARFPDENIISPISLEETENDIGIEIIKKNYTKIDNLKESITTDIKLTLEVEYQTNSLKYAWSDSNDDELFNTTNFSDFLLDTDNKATLLSLPLDKSKISHYLYIKAMDNNGNIIKGKQEVKKEIYAILYSNNSDNTDLELVFNSTGEVDDTRNAIVQTGNIISTSYNSAGARPWNTYIANIKTVTIEDQIFPRNMQYWLYGATALTQINGIEEIDTSNVASMYGLFYKCSNLTTIDVSGFDTSKATHMTYMFYGCSALTSLDVSGFNTSNVKKMPSMFQGCSGLTNLDVSGFDTSSATDMGGMFQGCSGLTSLDVSGFNTSIVDTMKYMFQGCKKLTSIDLSSFNTSNTSNMSYMFKECSSLTSLDLTGFDTGNVLKMNDMFEKCNSLTSINLSSFNTSNVNDMNYMFLECSGLTSLDVTSFDTSKVTNMWSMFSGCSGLTSLDVTNFDTSSVTQMELMFSGCSSLTSLNLSNFNTSQVTTMVSMFAGCDRLASIDLSSFNTSQVTTMKDMFKNCYNITILDLSGFNTSNVISMYGMFYQCKKITTIYAGDNWNVDNVTNSTNMFNTCTKLVGDISFNSSYIDKTYAKTTGGYLTYKASPAP